MGILPTTRQIGEGGRGGGGGGSRTGTGGINNILGDIVLDPTTLKAAGIVIVCGSTALAVTAMTTMVCLMRSVSRSVGVAEPTAKQLSEEDKERSPLFRHFPNLSNKLAFRSLGAISKTPIHICTLTNGDQNHHKQQTLLKFYVKREDLINTTQYGGNKVRTLQHQLAVLEARRDRGDIAAKQLISVGSGGSNQVIATVVHSHKLGWDNISSNDDGNVAASAVNPSWFDKDEPDLDNTLNFLSVLSMPNINWTFDWGMKPSFIKQLCAIKNAFTQKTSIPMFLGGNCPVGVIGQASGIIELAEQIEAGDSPDIERIYLPVGSACTISGLVLGTVLVKHVLKMNAYNNPNFKIIGCNVMGNFANMDRLFGMHTNPLFGFMPLTITYSVVGACRTIKQLGGPDVEKECRDFIKHHVEMRSDVEVAGLYGTHTVKSREAAKYYDDYGVMTNYKTGKPEKELWVCGHFVAKALQPLLKDLEGATSSSSDENPERPKYMLWQTKSAIQPRGPINEFELIQKCNSTVKKWANDGQAESTKYRPGKVVVSNEGKPEDYRSIMTKINID